MSVIARDRLSRARRTAEAGLPGLERVEGVVLGPAPVAPKCARCGWRARAPGALLCYVCPGLAEG